MGNSSQALWIRPYLGDGFHQHSIITGTVTNLPNIMSHKVRNFMAIPPTPPLVSLNKPLRRPYFWGGYVIGGVGWPAIRIDNFQTPNSWLWRHFIHSLQPTAGTWKLFPWKRGKKTTSQYRTTVDGRNPANQLRLVVYPIIYRVSAPSQVVVWDFFHQQYHWLGFHLNFREYGIHLVHLASMGQLVHACHWWITIVTPTNKNHWNQVSSVNQTLMTFHYTDYPYIGLL